MFHVAINPLWTVRRPDGRVLGARVVELLVRVDEHGSLAAACTAMGASYRHAWQLLREGEAVLGEPLLVMARGKGSQLTVLGERLVWAQRRIQARLSPALESLASEIGAEIDKALSAAPERLRLHASHGFAVQALHDALAAEGVAHELKYCGSAEALASLRDGGCDLAGFHVPMGNFEAAAVAHYRQWLDEGRNRLIVLATRRQGLMVARGNPKKIYDIADLARPDVRFVNRQAGSGTRYLLDLELQARGIEPSAIQGYEQCEFTHAAVAAYVASGMADATFGVEVPAREFRLEFLPTHQERYFLACTQEALERPAVRRLLALLEGPALRASVDALPGYRGQDMGAQFSLATAFASTAAAAAPEAPGPPRRSKGAAGR